MRISKWQQGCADVRLIAAPELLGYFAEGTPSSESIPGAMTQPARYTEIVRCARDHRGPVILGASGVNEENGLSGIVPWRAVAAHLLSEATLAPVSAHLGWRR